MSTGWIFIKEKIQNFFTFIKEKAKKTRKSDKQPGIRIATNSFSRLRVKLRRAKKD